MDSVSERIKGSFLECVSETGFLKTNITQICKKAGIHRSTFYSYYRKKEDVLNDLIDDSLSNIDNIINQTVYKEKNGSKIPLCIFLRESKEYHPIFRDPSLKEYIIGRIIVYFKEDYIEKLSQTGFYTKEEMDGLIWFQMYGCFHLAIKHLNDSNEIWNDKKCVIDRFLGKALS